MKMFAWVGVLSLMAASASAGEVFGTVSENGKPVAQGVAVKLDCAGTSAAGATDSYGSYSVKIAATGDCRVSVQYKGVSPSLNVSLYDKPSRYDVVIKEEAGKLTLARK